MAVSSSEEMDAVEVDPDGLRPSGERPRSAAAAPSPDQAATDPLAAWSSAPPTVRPPAPKGEAFDDVTPTRSIVEVGLADMDEDLPTRMQALDELARFRTAAADEGPAPLEPTPTPVTSLATPRRRDVLRPPPAPVEPAREPASDGVSFRSFPAPRGRDSVPVVPPVPAAAPLPREAGALTRHALEDGLTHGGTSVGGSPVRRAHKALVGLSFALLVLAVGALVIEHFAR